MNNQNFDPFCSSDSPSQSSNNSTATSHLPGFGTTYNPATQSQAFQPQSQPFQPQSQPFQPPNPFSGCYRPQLPNQEYQYQQQQQIWNQQTYHHQQQWNPQQPFPLQQPFPPQPFLTPQFCTQPTPPPQFATPQPPSSSQPPSTSSPKKNKNTKPKKTAEQKASGLKWTEAESLALAKCWIHVSEDPYVSTNQDKDSFWYRILGLFNEDWAHTNRTKDSLSGKWEHIRSKVSKFNGIYSQLVQSGRASGTSDTDVFTAALNEYKMVVLHDFPHPQCWEFLKDQQKFINPDPCVIGRRNRKRDAGQTREVPLDVDEDVDVAATFHAQQDATPRPSGRSGKSQRTSSSSAATNSSSSGFYEGINDRLEEIHTKQAESLAKKMESSLAIKRAQLFKQRNLDLELLRSNIDDYPEEAREMIEQERARIMHNLATGYYNNV